MQIHELTLHTKIDEGVLDTIKSTASNVATTVKDRAGAAANLAGKAAQGFGIVKNKQAASAGILDPRAKLAAVKKNRDIVNLAQKFADEWVAQQPAPVSEAAPGAPTPAEMANLEKKIAAATAAQTPTQPTAQTAQYIKDFLAFANEKIAMRDPTTYQMIGLQAVEDSKNYTNELNNAKEAVRAAMGDPVKTKDAVTRYLLTAIAGAQLLSSQNRAKGSKQTPAYGQAATQPARPGVTQLSQPQAPAANTTGLNPSDINALMQSAGLPAQLLGQAGQKFQAITNNKILTSTGDRVADHLLRSMGYKVQ